MTDTRTQWRLLAQYEKAVRATKNCELIEEYFYWLGALHAVNEDSNVYDWLEEYNDIIEDLIQEVKNV